MAKDFWLAIVYVVIGGAAVKLELTNFIGGLAVGLFMGGLLMFGAEQLFKKLRARKYRG